MTAFGVSERRAAAAGMTGMGALPRIDNMVDEIVNQVV
jgi:hypothetical protein